MGTVLRIIHSTYTGQIQKKTLNIVQQGDSYIYQHKKAGRYNNNDMDFYIPKSEITIIIPIREIMHTYSKKLNYLCAHCG